MFLTPHPTWEVLDSSKLTELMTCPRKFFYRYILGWTQDIPNLHLIFGGAWHRSMEVLLKEGYTIPAIINAVEAFNSEFIAKYPANAEESPAKNAAVVPSALAKYTSHYARDTFPGTAKVHHVEIAGTVPIDTDRLIHFRLDSIIEDEQGRMFSLEHKTASRFDRNWMDQWSLAFPVFTYLHVLYSLYDFDQVYGVVINGTAFSKPTKAEQAKGEIGSVDFTRVPIRKSVDMLNAWLYEANHWMDLLDLYMAKLDEASPHDTVLETFPKNPTACTKYFGCPYLGMCTSWANPLNRCAEVPPGFRQEWWNPADFTEAKCVADVGAKKIEDITSLEEKGPQL